MTVPRIEYKGHLPQPMGIRKACVKMALIEAETARALPLAKADADLLRDVRAEMGPTHLTDEMAEQAARVGLFLCSEYDRLSQANDHLERECGELREQVRLLEERLRDVPPMATDGGGDDGD